MELDNVLLVLRVIFHFGITVGIGCYQPHGARQRWGVSILATALATSNAGLGVALLTGAIDPNLMGSQWLYVISFGALFALILNCRGNLARLIPRRKAYES